MPHKSLTDLPPSVRRVLPKHAQEIYLKAFNSAWETYRDPRRIRNKESREEVASKVAWSAVKEKFVKDDLGTWVER
ncbi:MAG: ChaB family protein [Candidatus Aenigmarchaeota archaeon]|nr:ChaB family protein [Candidatus Aenigmarchaeota archaeon]